MNLHPKNVQLRRSVDMAKRPPNDSKFFLVVVLILKIANLDAAAGFEDFCPQKYALTVILSKTSVTPAPFFGLSENFCQTTTSQ